MRMYSVYCYTNKINNKKYVGVTSNNVEVRSKAHYYASRKIDNKFYRAIRKYGWDNFKLDILEIEVSQSDIDGKEQYYIEMFDSYENGYNSTIGGVCKPCKNKKTPVYKYVVDLGTGIVYNNVSECSRAIGETRRYVMEQLSSKYGSIAYCNELGGPIDD